ncbi:ABC transporter ATP-binding protein [Halalkalibacterium halodurans]|uniref:ABC transporter ATP-binding protein n=1 Tax=Halalkalibacterium halodurans TaxID=86665 RepID=UPI002E22BCB0|nr:ABC transporter ATP-binding protein [Halalkalibacterium halodurans]MED4085355.1 ABC transporter ATP-binding protein [Halalkalibacterium halodurans]MED4105391.1 ABC transporter ATP-binding protein [Halalkalibacterium halodurans]MED4108198.1 ABC transporter ATP-binding protein [Halalkalibacterium halodurans]MED4124117.1 ABC transporter ATP-binding protein [Halalkalibacterium halodurans]
MSIIHTESLSIGYGDTKIVEDLNIAIPEGKITTIIGANGCGKSTILKTISRIHAPQSGVAYLDGKAIHKQKTRDIAKKMAILPQTPESPGELTVYELVSYGRFPHQKGFGRLTEADHQIVEKALHSTGLEEFRHRPIQALSGGQRQRVWIAMALAQQTPLLLLDEPTTYLDMAHQLEVLLLLKKLNEQEGRTIVMVLHDLNHAARFSDYLIALRKGTVVKEGTPEDVMCSDVLRDVFQIEATIVNDPTSGKPVCLSYDTLTENIENETREAVVV